MAHVSPMVPAQRSFPVNPPLQEKVQKNFGNPTFVGLLPGTSYNTEGYDGREGSGVRKTGAIDRGLQRHCCAGFRGGGCVRLLPSPPDGRGESTGSHTCRMYPPLPFWQRQVAVSRTFCLLTRVWFSAVALLRAHPRACAAHWHAPDGSAAGRRPGPPGWRGQTVAPWPYRWRQ